MSFLDLHEGILDEFAGAQCRWAPLARELHVLAEAKHSYFRTYRVNNRQRINETRRSYRRTRQSAESKEVERLTALAYRRTEARKAKRRVANMTPERREKVNAAQRKRKRALKERRRLGLP